MPSLSNNILCSYYSDVTPVDQSRTYKVNTGHDEVSRASSGSSMLINSNLR